MIITPDAQSKTTIYAARNYPVVESCQGSIEFWTSHCNECWILKAFLCSVPWWCCELVMRSNHSGRRVIEKSGSSKLKVVFLALQDYTYHILQYHVFHVFLCFFFRSPEPSHYTFIHPLRHFWKALWTPNVWIHMFYFLLHSSTLLNNSYHFVHQSQNLTDQ